MKNKHFSLYHALAILSDEKSQQDQSEHKKRSTRYKQLIFVLSGIIIFTAIILFYVLYLHAENSVYIYEDSIQIKGTYGVAINFSEISDVELIDKSMEEIGIPRRRHGVVTGDILKGRYVSDIHDNTLLFVRQRVAPTIQIIRENEGSIFLSFADTQYTNEIYLNIRVALG